MGWDSLNNEPYLFSKNNLNKYEVGSELRVGRNKNFLNSSYS